MRYWRLLVKITCILACTQPRHVTCPHYYVCGSFPLLWAPSVFDLRRWAFRSRPLTAPHFTRLTVCDVENAVLSRCAHGWRKRGRVEVVVAVVAEWRCLVCHFPRKTESSCAGDLPTGCHFEWKFLLSSLTKACQPLCHRGRNSPLDVEGRVISRCKEQAD